MYWRRGVLWPFGCVGAAGSVSNLYTPGPLNCHVHHPRDRTSKEVPAISVEDDTRLFVSQVSAHMVVRRVVVPDVKWLSYPTETTMGEYQTGLALLSEEKRSFCYHHNLQTQLRCEPSLS